MGFFDSLVNALANDRLTQLKNQYNQMNFEQITEAWNSKFGNWVSTLREADLSNSLTRFSIESSIDSFRRRYQELPDFSILDDIYSSKTGKKTFLAILDEYSVLIEKAKADVKEKQDNLAKFKESLNTNDMVSEIISKIDEFGYEAEIINVRSDYVSCYDRNEINGFQVVYKKYGYPNLDEEQIEILSAHLLDRLKLNFVRSSAKYDFCIKLYLNDAPGGMKSSW